ncbi:MAG: metallophosphoesterase family protein [Akkermansiaceae bacterium]|nr:metallophosphoesterase family protein [Armatimonadota bacterium]
MLTPDQPISDKKKQYRIADKSRDTTYRRRYAGLIGDVHGQARTLETVLLFLQTLALDVLICTGDLPIKGYTQSPETVQTANECARLLQSVDVQVVRGNHDRNFVENAADPLLAAMFREEWDASREAVAFAKSLPKTRRFETPRGDLLLCHGFGEDDMAGIYPGGEDAPIAEALKRAGAVTGGIRYLVAGHTHRRLCRTVAGVTIINPGALIGDKESPGFATADLETGAVTFYTVERGGDIVAL